MVVQSVEHRSSSTRKAFPLLIAALSISAGDVWAATSFSPKRSSPVMPASLKITDQAVGSVIFTSTPVRSKKVDPSAASVFAWVLGSSQLVPGYTNVYKTNLDGIGIRWAATVYGNNFTNGRVLSIHGANSVASGGIAASLPEQQVSFELLRVAKVVKPGQLTITGQTVLRFNCAEGDSKCAWFIDFPNSTSVGLGACEVPASIPVSLGKYPQFEFRESGSVSPWVKFDIDLKKCSTGYQQLLYKLTPKNGVVDESKAILDIKRGGATGVGVEVKDDWNKIPAKLNSPQVLAGLEAGTQDVTVPMEARIVKTGTTVAPGKVESALELTIEYR